MSPTRPIANGARGSRTAPPTNAFKVGNKGGPGRPALPPEVREALKADTLPRYERLKKLSADAEAAGDLKTAAHIELALLKKQIPDLSAVEVTGADGEPLEVNARIDVSKLSHDDLVALRVMQAKSRREESDAR